MVPFRMERVSGDVETGHLGVGNLHALFVVAGFERALDFEPGLHRGGADQLDHGEAVCQRTPPVLRDAAEQPVLDLVPLRRAWRIVVGVNRRLERLNSRAPKCASSSETLRLTVASGTLSLRPAAERLPVSTTLSRIDMASRRSMRLPSFERTPPDTGAYLNDLEEASFSTSAYRTDRYAAKSGA